MPARFTLVEVLWALQQAHLDSETTWNITRTLNDLQRDRRKRRGRRPEDDEELLARMKKLVDAGMVRWQAAGFVTKDLKEPARKQVWRRIYDKFRTRR